MNRAIATTLGTVACVLFIILIVWRDRPATLIPKEHPTSRAMYDDDQTAQQLQRAIDRRRPVPDCSHIEIDGTAAATIARSRCMGVDIITSWCDIPLEDLQRLRDASFAPNLPTLEECLRDRNN